jgi:osmotically-inducible protein OsmY
MSVFSRVPRRLTFATGSKGEWTVSALLDASADCEVARQVVAALRRELPLCWEQIRPAVRAGVVMLEGKVEWIHERAEAESVARGVPGVVGVVNSIAFCGHL